MERKKLQHNQMVKALREKGITFDIIKEKDAMKILSDSNYYYKLTCYRKNYRKIDGKYQDLDFAYLVDLASIDMQLRYHIMKMALDIEHSIKTALLRKITNNGEDGYSIILEFKDYDPGNYRRTISVFKKSEYLNDMYQKRSNNIPAWVFIEIMDYGSLSKFVSFYRSKYKADDLKQAELLLPYSKHLRNSAAHSNALLLNIYGTMNFLRDKDHNIVKPSAQVVSYGDEFKISREELRHNKIHDLVCLFKLHKMYTSNAIHSNRLNEYRILLQRIDRHSEYYKNNEILSNFFSVLSKLNV
jgi:hypothetical protein